MPCGGLEQFVDIDGQTYHQVDAIGEGAVVVVVLGFVVEEIVQSRCHLESFADALNSREFPIGIGRVVNGAGTFGDIVVVDELHVLHIGEEASIEGKTQTIVFCELLVPIDTCCE